MLSLFPESKVTKKFAAKSIWGTGSVEDPIAPKVAFLSWKRFSHSRTNKICRHSLHFPAKALKQFYLSGCLTTSGATPHFGSKICFQIFLLRKQPFLCFKQTSRPKCVFLGNSKLVWKFRVPKKGASSHFIFPHSFSLSSAAASRNNKWRPDTLCLQTFLGFTNLLISNECCLAKNILNW